MVPLNLSGTTKVGRLLVKQALILELFPGAKIPQTNQITQQFFFTHYNNHDRSLNVCRSQYSCSEKCPSFSREWNNVMYKHNRDAGVPSAFSTERLCLLTNPQKAHQKNPTLPDHIPSMALSHVQGVWSSHLYCEWISVIIQKHLLWKRTPTRPSLVEVKSQH